MKVLFITSEAAPFAKTGGLGDVAGSLPQALRAQGADVSVVMPMYEAIPARFRVRMKLAIRMTVRLAWRRQDCAVYTLEEDGLTYYFLDNEYYFRRRELYGHYDDGERFSFFSKAVLDMMNELDYFPDILHANDWQSALVPIYLRLSFAYDRRYGAVKTVFTIHNIQYQGFFPRDFLTNVVGLDDEHFRSGLLAYDDGISLMKGAILCADFVTTVSPTYAQEIRTPYYGRGLDAILRENECKLAGVLNGIDMEGLNPATDPRLFANYSADAPQGKAANKESLLGLLGMRADTGAPLIALITRLAEHKGLDLISTVIDDLMAENVRFVVLGRGEWRYEQLFEQWQQKYPGRISANIIFSNDLAGKIYAGADMLLMPSKSEPCGLAQMIAMRYGTVPIVRETGGLRDTVEPYNEFEGSGTGFTFTNYSAHDMLYVIRRAVALYNDRDAWTALQRRGMSQDFGWSRSACEYIGLYKKICAVK